MTSPLRVCVAAGALLAIFATGCRPKSPSEQAETPAGSTPPVSASPMSTAAPEPPPGVLRAYYWTCEGGLEFVARNLWRENAMTLELHEGAKRLERVPSASGTKYANASIEFWTKGGAGTFERKPAAPVKCTENPARSLLEDARARGVVLRGRGNEPGWILEIGPQQRMAFETRYGNERHVFTNTRASGGPADPSREYTAEEAGQSIRVVVRNETCVDDMSGETFEYSFAVTYAASTLRGCGDRLQAG
jgi:uncharacterized membrane protein